MNIAVVGLGLIGGSVLQGLARGGRHRLLGFDADPAVRATARDAAARRQPGARWQITATVRDAAAGADLVVLAVPLAALDNALDALVASGFSGLITDVTSVKGAVTAAVSERVSGSATAVASFIGGHPMAGREVSGFAAADPDLFTGCAWVLCLDDPAALEDWLTVADLVTQLGARVVPLTTQEHDSAVAIVSHVPHLVASAISATAADDLPAQTLAAGSFRDGTRVAANRPDLVAAMCGGNVEAVRAALDELRRRLDEASRCLDQRDPAKAIRDWALEGHEARLAWPPDPGRPQQVPANAETLLRLGRAGGWITTVAPDRRNVTGFLPVRGT